MNDRRWMLLMSLLGLFIPLGNILGPVFIKARSTRSEAFRSKLLIIEGGILALGFVPSVIIIINSMSVTPEGAMTIDPAYLTRAVCWLFVLPVLILSIPFILWRQAAP